MMDFYSLRVFVTVVECGGFHAAANLLFKSQPAITTAIKKLEEEIGLALFDRAHYRPTLTPQGEKLYHRAKALMGHWQHINQFVSLLKAEKETDITIAVDVFYPIELLKDLFTQWMTRYRETHFHFLLESLGGACERLIQHHADIIISENLISGQAIEVIPLHSEPMIAVATSQFIADHREQLYNLDTLKDCMQVILKDSSSSDFSFGVIEHCHHWTVSDVSTKKKIILSGLGWGRLPYFLIREELSDGSLQPLVGHHFDERRLMLAAIRLQKPKQGPIAEELWADLLRLKLSRPH